MSRPRRAAEPTMRALSPRNDRHDQDLRAAGGRWRTSRSKVEAGTFHALLARTVPQVDAGEMHHGLLRTHKGAVCSTAPNADHNPRDARAHGIGMVYQHFNAVPSPTGAENLVIVRADAPAVIDWKKEDAPLEEFLSRIPFRVPLDVPVSALAAGEKQKLEIRNCFISDPAPPDLDCRPRSLTPEASGRDACGLLRGMGAAKEITVSHDHAQVAR